MASELSLWPAVASACAAWLALVLSLFNLRTSRRALRLAERQEERRQPLLLPQLENTFLRFDSKNARRVFGFLFSVSNRSDSDNAIAEAELRVTYLGPGGHELIVKLGTNPELWKKADAPSSPLLDMPHAVGAHQTARGWLYFSLSEDILAGALVQRYIVALVDSHGIEVTVEPIVLREESLVSEKTRSATHSAKGQGR